MFTGAVLLMSCSARHTEKENVVENNQVLVSQTGMYQVIVDASIIHGQTRDVPLLLVPENMDIASSLAEITEKALKEKGYATGVPVCVVGMVGPKRVDVGFSESVKTQIPEEPPYKIMPEESDITNDILWKLLAKANGIFESEPNPLAPQGIVLITIKGYTTSIGDSVANVGKLAANTLGLLIVPLAVKNPDVVLLGGVDNGVVFGASVATGQPTLKPRTEFYSINFSILEPITASVIWHEYIKFEKEYDKKLYEQTLDEILSRVPPKQ